MQAGVTDDLQQHSRLISSKVCHISLGSHLAHCRLKFKPVAKKKTHSVWKPNPCLCGLSGQREQTTVPLSVNRGRWFTERYRLLLRSCKIKCPLDTCQGVRFMPRGNKRAPNASLFYSRLGQPDLILKANFWKRRLRNKTMQFFFFFYIYPCPFSWAHISWDWHTRSKKLKSWQCFCSAHQEQTLIPWNVTGAVTYIRILGKAETPLLQVSPSSSHLWGLLW